MLVLDEARLLNSGPEYEEQLTKEILRDRNHPSIFMWSIGNEEWIVQTSEVGKRIAQNQLDIVARLDPTRLCTEAVNEGNIYRGVNEVLPVRGFNYHLPDIDPYRKEHPDQPIMGSEMASTVSTPGDIRQRHRTRLCARLRQHLSALGFYGGDLVDPGRQPALVHGRLCLDGL